MEQHISEYSLSQRSTEYYLASALVIPSVTTPLRKIFSLSPADLGATNSSDWWGILPGSPVVARPTIATARNMLRIVGLRQDVSARVCRENRAGESARAPAGLFQVGIVIGILLAHGSNFCAARFIAGAQARRYEFAVSALPAAL